VSYQLSWSYSKFVLRYTPYDPTLQSNVRFYKACETAQLVNIYGSTEIGADVCYAVLSPPPASAHHPHLQPHPHPPAQHQLHAHRDLATHALNTSDSNIQDTSDTLPIPQGDASTSPLKSLTGSSKPDKYSASMYASWWLGNAPIGHPIDGNDLYIARIKETNNSGESSVEDLLFELVADGEPGELFVGGKQLAMGYHDRPADTAERFVSRKVIIGIDAIFQERITGREGGVEEQQQKQAKEAEKEEEVEEEGENNYHSPVEGAISSVTDPITGPIHRGKLFRTGDIVVRIPKGPQVRAPVHGARCDMTRGRMEEDGDGEGQGEEEGTGRGVSDTGRDEGNEVERSKEAMIENERMMNYWAGAIVWLGRRDLQVPYNAI
jgi:acyl-CoA synthetase (AMP-forming)/AMP-acid ligase II